MRGGFKDVRTFTHQHPQHSTITARSHCCYTVSTDEVNNDSGGTPTASYLHVAPTQIQRQNLALLCAAPQYLHAHVWVVEILERRQRPAGGQRPAHVPLHRLADHGPMSALPETKRTPKGARCEAVERSVSTHEG